MDYIIAGTIKKDGRSQRAAGIVTIEDSGNAFTNDIRALGMLPVECQRARGKNAPEVWPLGSAAGTRLAIAAGLLTPTPAVGA
jgi:hypothetical protein